MKYNSSLWSNYKFGVIDGQILNYFESRLIIFQNDAWNVSFSRRLVYRSPEVLNSQKIETSNLNSIKVHFSILLKLFVYKIDPIPEKLNSQFRKNLISLMISNKMVVFKPCSLISKKDWLAKSYTKKIF